MKYNSIREYFYKLNNLLFILILLPLLVFVVLYWQIQEGNVHAPFYFEEDITRVVSIVAGAILFTDWVISFMLVSKRLKAIRRIQSLGTRLDRYSSLTIFRFMLIVSGSLVLAIGFFLTEDQLFTIMAVLNVFLLLFLWPRASKTCNDLKLKGDEHTLVFYKKDKLH